MEYQGVTYRLFATLSEGNPSVPFLKDVLWEHQEKPRKRESVNLRQAAELHMTQKELQKKNELLIKLLQGQLNDLQNWFFEWTRNNSRVAP
jgi:isoleucyl-tRNA synthetase